MGSPSFDPCESTLVRVVSTDHARGSAPLAIATIGCPTGEIPAAAGSLSCAYLQFMARGVYLRWGPCQLRHADSIAHLLKNARGACTQREGARISLPSPSRFMVPLARCGCTFRLAPSPVWNRASRVKRDRPQSDFGNDSSQKPARSWTDEDASSNALNLPPATQTRGRPVDGVTGAVLQNARR